MISMAKQLGNSGVFSLRALAAKLGTNQTSAFNILRISAIHNRFLAQGGAGGPLGPPTSAVTFAEGQTQRYYFSGGALRLSDAGTMTMTGLRVVEVLYQGFRCDAESGELSSQDEPYFFITVAGRLKRIGPISVDKENQYTDGHGALISISDYVVARDLYIDIIVREHDEGDPDEAEQAVKDALSKIVNDAATLASAASSGDGVKDGELASFAAMATSPTLGVLAPVISKVLGLEDDDVGTQTVALFQASPSGEAPVTPPLLGSVKSLEYNVVAPLIGADSSGENQGRGVYTLYFLVTVYNPPEPIWSNEL
jgi:hypothetical protein